MSAIRVLIKMTCLMIQATACHLHAFNLALRDKHKFVLSSWGLTCQSQWLPSKYVFDARFGCYIIHTHQNNKRGWWFSIPEGFWGDIHPHVRRQGLLCSVPPLLNIGLQSGERNKHFGDFSFFHTFSYSSTNIWYLLFPPCFSEYYHFCPLYLCYQLNLW